MQRIKLNVVVYIKNWRKTSKFWRIKNFFVEIDLEASASEWREKMIFRWHQNPFKSSRNKKAFTVKFEHRKFSQFPTTNALNYPNKFCVFFSVLFSRCMPSRFPRHKYNNKSFFSSSSNFPHSTFVYLFFPLTFTHGKDINFCAAPLTNVHKRIIKQKHFAIIVITINFTYRTIYFLMWF